MRTPNKSAPPATTEQNLKVLSPRKEHNFSRNSTRHGVFADTLVLEKENPAQFHKLLNELPDEHQPSTPTQTMLVETIVAARWRQRRIWGIQKMNFDYDIASITTNSENAAVRAALALLTNDESISSHELLLRFEIALDRQSSRALLRLQQLQDRKASRDSKRNLVPNREPVPCRGPGPAIEKKMILQNEPTNPLKTLQRLPRLILPMLRPGRNRKK